MGAPFRKTACLLLLVGIAVLVLSHLWMLLERANESDIDDEKFMAKSETLEGHAEDWQELEPMTVDRPDAENVLPDRVPPMSAAAADISDSSRDDNDLVDAVVQSSEGAQRSFPLQEANTGRSEARRLRDAASKTVDIINTPTPAAVAAPMEGDGNDRRRKQRAGGVRRPTLSNVAGDVKVSKDIDENIDSANINRVATTNDRSFRDPGSRPVRTDIDPDESPSNGLVNVVSMSLYGSATRYVNGAIRNAQLIRKNFPGWQLWIYVESSESSRYPAVPSDVISRLVELGADVHYVTPQDDFVPPMMWRFLVADDPAVDRFIVRDSDSRLTRRDSASVAAWIKSGRPFHCVRDHPSHAAYALSGGLWGGRAPALRQLMRRSWAALMRGVDEGYLNDMNFLNNVVWPRVERVAFCTDSVSCNRWTGAVPFPVARQGYEHVGQVYDENDVGRRGDTKILELSGENRDCVPKV